MNTCSTCKYWREDIMEVANLHACSCPNMFYGYSYAEAGNDKVIIENDEGWGMLTGPDFGCIHHTAD